MTDAAALGLMTLEPYADGIDGTALQRELQLAVGIGAHVLSFERAPGARGCNREGAVDFCLPYHFAGAEA